MKKIIFTFIIVSCIVTANAQLGNVIKNAKNKAKEKISPVVNTDNKNGDTTNTTDTSVTPADEPTSTNTEAQPAAPPSLKVYANYDFVPGSSIIFEDNFIDDQDGEFATHWDLDNGQAIINKIDGKSSFLVTEGNYGWVDPLIKNKKYLGSEWTIEYDSYNKSGSYPLKIFLQNEDKGDIGSISVTAGEVTVSFQDAEGNGKSLTGPMPEQMSNADFNDHWHHIAIAYKNKQIKVYVDQARLIVVPNSNIEPARIAMGGIGSLENPLVFTNFRIAEGGGMNMLGKKFTDTKIVTHGINFDVNKALIRPESMGTLNGIVQIMKDNPEIKFEIGGHTDSDGDDASNMKLSQQRADAVKTQLITMGVDASHLTAKGYGESKPMADNTTFEGKANNRRVEFVKM